jgi:uncharacterized protein
LANRLVDSNSPYLLQHANNPVNWYPWGEEALEKAKHDDKPIFISIGYAACHWCHVMAHESFEDPAIAALMNDSFVNIKVDREERPDLDNIYMGAVVAMSGHGGWPMSVFLTPDGQPFFGGTYFPPVPRHNLPSFRDVLTSVSRAWKEDREKIIEASETYTQHLRSLVHFEAQSSAIQVEDLDQAAIGLAQTYDWKNGGWGQAPKFPQPMAIEFLLRRATRGDKLALDIAAHALRSMARGGMYDVVGGGFARYSTDNKWLVPHFEKMLYDNAQLASVYLHAYLLTRDVNFLRVCEETLDFVMREMIDPVGGFYSSIDADSEGEEGKFYVWTAEEILKTINDPEDIELLIAAYDITDRGNFEGKNVLQRVLDDSSLAERFQMSPEDVAGRLERLHTALLRERNKRVRPGTDDKVLVSWNALMLVVFSEAGRYLKRKRYIDMAIRNAEFLLSHLLLDNQLYRSWRAGKAMHSAYLEDYAGLILGLLALYQSNPDPRWFSSALKLAEFLLMHFQDPEGGFFDTPDEHENLIIRPKDVQDNATPSGNALAAYALLQLAAYQGRPEFDDLAERMFCLVLPAAKRYPTVFSYWLCAADFSLNLPLEVAILGDSGNEATEKLVEALWSVYRPNLVAAISPFPPPPNSPVLLNDRSLFNGMPSAYVCRSFVCKLPVNDPEGLHQQLDA